jgi:hypothetical protein
MLLVTHPAIVVATDNRLIATNIGLLAGVATTLGWAAAIWRASGAVVDLSDWVAWGQGWATRWSVRRVTSSGDQRVL